MKRGVVVLLIAGMLLSGCASVEWSSEKGKKGAGIGAVSGGILGAIIDSNKPWRGAIIGGATGAIAGALIGDSMDKNNVVETKEDIVERAAKEAATLNTTVKYSRTTENGITEEIIATPGKLEGNERTVTIQYLRDGKVISTETRKVKV